MEINIFSLITYFIIYSFLGWVMESIFRSIAEKKIINSGFLYGPFCPIYGIGAIIMFLFLNGFKENIILLFIISFVVLSIWEYLVGWLLEIVFHTKYWDYSDNKYNIQGRLCLMNSLFWGVLGVVFIRIIHPFVIDVLSNVDKDVVNISTLIIGVYILIDAIVTIVKVKKIDIRLSMLAELNETIKQKLRELKNTTADTTAATLENMQLKIDELKSQQTRLKRKLLKQTIRLKKAFPTMKSERITEFLSQKVDEIRRK